MRRKNPRYLWETWSPTKLWLLLRCPRLFYLTYILKIELRPTLPLAFGEAIHTMFKRFFSLKNGYKSAESFANQWPHYWDGVLKGKYGKKIAVILKKDQDPGKYFGLGRKILEDFYLRNEPYRDFKKRGKLIKAATKPKPEVEVSFEKFPFAGVFLTGKWDRIQPLLDGGKAIWDYKTGWFQLPPEAKTRNLQFTIYQLAFETKFKERPREMAIYHCYSGDLLPMPLRTDRDYQDLAKILNWARNYIQTVYQQISRLCPNSFLCGDPNQGIFIPRFDDHYCPYCRYEEICRQMPIGKTEELASINKELARLRKPEPVSPQAEQMLLV